MTKIKLPATAADLVAQVLDDLLYRLYDAEADARYIYEQEIHTLIDALRSGKKITIEVPYTVPYTSRYDYQKQVVRD